MRILHYTIGFPPERSGGLPRYALDLMTEQKKQGNEVFALYPGRINFLKKSSYIRKNKRKDIFKIETFELINSLPLPLLRGIKVPEHFMKKNNNQFYKEFLAKINVDIIHIHTLMGIHREFFEVAKKNGIKIVFTSHDYFGISPVPDFYVDGKSWDRENSNEFWVRCSKYAYSTKKLRIFQFSFYSIIRVILNCLFKRDRMSSIENNCEIKKDQIDFNELRDYYFSILNMVDSFHFNSKIAEKVYLENVPSISNKVRKVIIITNSTIKKNTTSNIKVDKIARIAYIGPFQESKGFYDFLDFARIHKDEGIKFIVYGGSRSTIVPEYIENGGRFNHINIEKIFSSIDLVVVPSRWKETFGFVTLEALSNLTPVIVSKNVGSKVLVDRSFVFEDLKKFKLPQNIEMENVRIKEIEYHAEEILSFYMKGNIND